MIICSLDDISSDLDELNGNGIPNERNKEEIKKRFCHAIRFYSDAKQLGYCKLFFFFKCTISISLNSFRFIAEFNDIYEFNTFALFLFSLLSLTASLLVFLSQSVEYILKQ